MRRKWFSKALLGLTIFTVLLSCKKDDDEVPAAFAVDPSTKNFGQVRVGAQDAAQFTVSNPGGLPLELLSYSFTGEAAASFTTTLEATTVDPGASAGFQVDFAPVSEGNQDAQLKLLTNIGEQIITLSGFGLPALVPTATLSETELDFDRLIVNESKPLSVTITNSGNTELEISAIAITGDQAATFSTEATPQNLAIQANKEIVVNFSPTATGVANATLEITTNAGVKTVNLTGMADPQPAPVLELSTTSLDFGNVQENQERELVVTLTNSGNLPLTFGSVAFTGPQEDYFDADFKEEAPLAAGASIAITFSFYPEALGAASANFNITTNGGDATIALSGIGIAPPPPSIIIDPAALDFQEVSVGQTKSLGFDLSNGGPGVLNISAIQITGANASDFRLVNVNAPLQLQNGEGLRLEVEFVPQTTGDKIALVSISSNDPAKGELAVMIQGEGEVSFVNIPNAAFKAALVGATAINTDGDNEISFAEALAYTGAIRIPQRNINDLTGIEAFENITILEANRNNLSTVDLSANSKLTQLDLDRNQLATLDLSNNTELTSLRLANNQLASLSITTLTKLTQLTVTGNRLSQLDLSQNALLEVARLDYNDFTSLDFSNNPSLSNLRVNENKLTQLNIANGANAMLAFFSANNNPDLSCIQIDTGYNPVNQPNWIKNTTANYSSNCN